jgi:hypothetical protein
VTVELPERSCLRAEADFADFRCDGRLDDVEVKTDAGDVRLDQTGALRVRSGAGHVALEEASGRAEIVAAGDMTIGVVASDADVKNLNIETASGGLEIGVREGTAAWIDAATKFGRVHNNLTSADDPNRQPRQPRFAPGRRSATS